MGRFTKRVVRIEVPRLIALFCLFSPSLPPAQAENSDGPVESARPDSATVDSQDDAKRGVITSTLAKANPIAAGGQTVDAVKWMSRRHNFTLNGAPYGFTGLPVVYFSPNTGWNYGGRLQWVDYGLNRRPYRYKMTFYTLKSTEGTQNFTLKFKVPRISGTGWGVRMLAKAKRDLRTRYYGKGNDSAFVEDFTDKNSLAYKDENYYFYVLEKPQFIFSLLREIYGPVSLSVGFGIESSDVSARGDSSFFNTDAGAVGTKDGASGFFSLTMQWDSRDDATIARSGAFHEWSYENSRNSVVSLFLDKIDFRRYTFTDIRYHALNERLLLAHRTVFEVLDGTVPLYAYGEMGGTNRIKGLGGSDTLRGFDKQRFTDDVRAFTNTEVRYTAYTIHILCQYLEWQPAIFFDTGRVWSDVGKVALKDFHQTTGIGSRLIWNSDFVIRTDLGLSNERNYFTLKYRHLF